MKGFRSNKRQNTRRQRRRDHEITSHDLDAVRTRGTEEPPPLPINNVVLRRTRLEFAVGSTAPAFSITSAVIAAQDQADYGTVGVRFSQIRTVKAELWFSPIAWDQSGVSAAGSTIQLTDRISGQTFNDAVNQGVDYGHISIRPSLQNRQFWRPVTDTTALFSIYTTITGSSTGIFYLDITFEAS